MIFLDRWSVLLILALIILFISLGGLISSLLNRRELRAMGIKIDRTDKKLDHTNNNARQAVIAAEALGKKLSKEIKNGNGDDEDYHS